MVLFYRKSERLMQPGLKLTKERELGCLRPELHGTNGPLDTSVPTGHSPFDVAWSRTYTTLGQRVNCDPRDGLALGGYTNLLSLDSRTNERSFAAIAYLEHTVWRQNLHIVTEALVEKIVFADTKVSGKLVATGIQYRKNNAMHIF